MSSKRIVITGGPSTGKSAIISELLKREYTCLEEISRQVILDAKKKGIDQLFLTNPLLFSELLLEGRQQQFEITNTFETPFTFYDRGIPDIVAYMDFIGATYPTEFTNACKNAVYDTVFILKPWEDIYTVDNERYESFEQALKIHDNLVNTYKNYNYTLIDVPFDTVENRCDFILKVLGM
ncbi:AAA family ATPase [Siansivirga zeaxanthinifaciens]|uniref:ATPase n=1 Tax=Siansivirga zeaxanthinifaciens CC-SAMT-1 TaxID=1454006 RepID=A0A0C5WC57_9FLAO|nr:ATP-binding protein [Siansivirga zeaxanthinifaciens]AJR03877.1 ATPase [Siansivirga zeaxanthinifaciens CC-SAMT-1]